MARTGQAGMDIDKSWKAEAACIGIDPDVFYPHSDRESGPARAICNECPVQEPCLSYALAVREKDGIWGGKDPQERRRILRQRTRKRITSEPNTRHGERDEFGRFIKAG